MVMGDMAMSTDLLVIGGGPGGYGAAFRGADLGLDVTLVDQLPLLGGLCLHAGCIPSKTLLHLVQLLQDARGAKPMGIDFGEPQIDLAAMRSWQQQVVGSIADGLVTLARQRGILVVHGRARFADSGAVRLEGAELSSIRFKQAIIATGSRPRILPGLVFAPGGRILDPAAALALAEIPKSLIIVGGGYVGLEIGSIYAALGSRVTLLDQRDRLLAAADPDLVAPLARRLGGQFAEILLGTRMTGVDEEGEGISVLFSRDGKDDRRNGDRILLAIGRIANSNDLGLEHTAVTLDSRGVIKVDANQRTTDPAIFAVGDVAGARLAHKATRQGRVAAEVSAGKKSGFDALVIPAVVYTDPQIAWCGLTEARARHENIPHTVQHFPWKYSGRAQSLGITDGFTKLLTDPADGRILGVGITGRGAEGLIGEAALAIEMGALAEDLALTLHPHPTLSETEGEAAEIFVGSPTHMLPKEKT
jgi:dihydrolipoamide dehydrogenase